MIYDNDPKSFLWNAMLTIRYYDYVWTNWCDLVDGGCPDTVEFNRVDTTNILWDKQILQMVNAKFDINKLLN